MRDTLQFAADQCGGCEIPKMKRQTRIGTPETTLKRDDFRLISVTRHCEERSDEAIHNGAAVLDCFASLAMTNRVHRPKIIML
jgi:hypothetical protein